MNILISGVGGQGVLLISNIIAQAAISADFDVKTNEVHGMAQRGGSVLAQVRFGKKIYSPLVWEGTADIIISLEQSESLRYAHFLKRGGLAVTSTQTIIPVTVSSGKAKYPIDMEDRLKNVFPRLIAMDARAEAQKSGNIKAANVVVLGASANEFGLTEENWNKALSNVIPQKYLAINKIAFEAGRRLNK
ncbi:MAG: indolepyruvate oxidoreductase subunit beta [Brevinematales bacterium]|jgi:indolepyruvate ferredoxin oxidoreductase beta subunit